MGKKKNKSNGGENNNNGGNEENNNNGGKEENNNGGNKENNNNNNTMILKVHMHCDGCASKITKYLHSIKGVETVKTESETGKVTVTGKVDPTKVRDNLAEKTKKKVELISPQPKKEKENNKKENEPNNNKSDDKKTKDNKELITTSVLKMVLHCQGCIDKIEKIVMKTKGVIDMKIDKEKNNVTVKGTMDVKGLVENLSEKLKKKVEVVPPKKDKEGGGGGGDGGGGGKKKNKGGGGGGGEEGGDNGNNGGGEVKMMEHLVQVQPPYGFGYGNVEGYNGQVYQELIHFHMNSQPPQMFSDENPNACIVM
ncbi:heavy metal transport/detoxification domain-containing protein [Trifolium pratense]|uniref:Heavy metal transport/detoxification domain-containing protein n=1 Tax=Trifolium pratense TaxID=57577 RepID=A0A2K3PR23_TRIPR|nr:heavy metal transport/detoxification domain-containing protein [Trifolium pratense]